MNKSIILLVLLSTLTFCKKSDKKITPVCDGSNTTYNNFVSDLIASKCASCHDYSTYDKLKVITDNGKFTQQVLIDQSMPQNSSISEADLNRLQCWVENNFPEN